jgi:nitrite transporter NirC
MYQETIRALEKAAVTKWAFLRANPLGYLVSSMLAGAYVGVGIFLVFAIGGPLAAAGSPWLKTIMGASFAVALSLVIFAGAELYTGNNLVMTVGVKGRVAGGRALVAVWGISWVGNLLGAMLLAALLVASGVLNGAAEHTFVQAAVAKKMHLTITELLARSMLCNWLVCLAVWCGFRMQTEIGKLVMIFWCLYAFIASGFEHSVANMTLLTVGLLQPHLPAVSWAGMGYNLLWVSLGNAIGGAIFVGMAYLAVSRDLPAEKLSPVPTGV